MSEPLWQAHTNAEVDKTFAWDMCDSSANLLVVERMTVTPTSNWDVRCRTTALLNDISVTENYIIYRFW